MPLTEDRLSTILDEEELMSEEDIEDTRSKVQKEGLDLYQYLLSQELVGKEDLGEVLAKEYGVDYIELSEVDIDPDTLKIIPEVVSRTNDAIIYTETPEEVRVAMFDPNNKEFIENVKDKINQKFRRNRSILEKMEGLTKKEVKSKKKKELINFAKDFDVDLEEDKTKEELVSNFFDRVEKKKEKISQHLDKDIKICFSHRKDIEEAINENYDSNNKEFATLIQDIIDRGGGESDPEDMPIIKIVDKLLNYAYENKASDVHIEPYDDKTLIRFRIDGILHDIISIPKSLHDLIVTRIKILSRLRTDEHRSAQDGKLKFNHKGDQVDVRVSIVPIVYGEKVVLRILAETAGKFTLDKLGFRDVDLEKIKENIDKPWGMILATGPTGSGKTTTLYSVIKRLNTREVNISTIEDPVEYGIESINQIQVNEETNLTFSQGLRAIVRQDPDIVMVGEIRDEETARIAVNAAMTGHLVLSTLHTNDAATTLPRLLDMGVQPFLVASTVNIAIAQRLVRRICDECKTKREIDEEMEELIKKELSEDLIEEHKLLDSSTDLYYGKGCPSCQDSGYQGRVGVYEVLDMTPELKDMVMKKENASDIKEKAVELGMLPLIQAGIEKVLDGTTTIEELLRVIQE